MINERAPRILRPTQQGGRTGRPREFRTESAMFGTAGFIIAVGIVSSIIFALSMRADRLSDRRRSYADGSTNDSGGIASGIGGYSLKDWFSSSSSAPSSSDSCSSSSYFSGDSSCSDGGGGGDGSGGGGD